jgi:hypothetical protein
MPIFSMRSSAAGPVRPPPRARSSRAAIEARSNAVSAARARFVMPADVPAVLSIFTDGSHKKAPGANGLPGIKRGWAAWCRYGGQVYVMSESCDHVDPKESNPTMELRAAASVLEQLFEQFWPAASSCTPTIARSSSTATARWTPRARPHPITGLKHCGCRRSWPSITGPRCWAARN